MRNDPDGSALNVACPCCGRRAGKACVSTSNGRPFTGWVHRERLTQAQQVPDQVPAATVEAWKTAVAAHQAKLRRQRTTRPAPEPHSYRKDPS